MKTKMTNNFFDKVLEYIMIIIMIVFIPLILIIPLIKFMLKICLIPLLVLIVLAFFYPVIAAIIGNTILCYIVLLIIWLFFRDFNEDK